MQIWMTLILTAQMLSALTMIGLVLIQHGKGADMGASFGSGASGAAPAASVPALGMIPGGAPVTAPVAPAAPAPAASK